MSCSPTTRYSDAPSEHLPRKGQHNYENSLPHHFASLVLATPLVGLAVNAKPLQPNEHPTNLPGVTTIEAPPAGFDVINASDEELAYHGFPPRPNQNTEPKAYATWVRAMNASATRIVPKLEPTAISHGQKGASQNATAATLENKVPLPVPHDNNLITTNMSGFVAQSGAISYGPNSFYYIVSNFVVPVAQQAGCTGGWAYASAWDGIDGFGSRMCFRPASSSMLIVQASPGRRTTPHGMSGIPMGKSASPVSRSPPTTRCL